MNLSEPIQPNNQTKFEEATSGVIHTGSGDVNILVPNVEGIISFIKQIIPSDQIDVVENFINALRQLRLCQKIVSELKSVHNMLHELETALATIESPIRTSIRQNEAISIYIIEDMWQLSVLPRIRHMKKFASE